MAQLFKKVAIFGAPGNIGSQLVTHLLKQDKHEVTAVTRPSSTAVFPSSVTVKKGSYTDTKFLETVLQGQDVVVLMLGFAALKYQDGIFEAAAKAGVKYVLPSDYGASAENEKIVGLVPLFKTKWEQYHKIESLGMKWVSVVTALWIDYSIEWGTFGFEVPERKATLYTDGVPFSTTTMARVGEGVAAFLELPKDVIEETFANSFLYLSSFTLSQAQIFEAVMRVTGTTETDWQIKHQKAQDLIDEGHAMVKSGQLAGHFKIIYGAHYQPGMGTNYSEKAATSLLGLPQEDLDKIVKAAVDSARPGGWDAAIALQLEKQ
ncbi:hypothetical protein PRZ48_009351 [Zasmidium cellare]|uniref:NmrA-like domain-containing protein n=1 Tax=Zasmidium cellare TaxID=395010 RepID=A0ABR0EBI0_ZASCE|nr:hypothetical protein PRZ48_009351 [Zasmidium cellare]